MDKGMRLACTDVSNDQADGYQVGEYEFWFSYAVPVHLKPSPPNESRKLRGGFMRWLDGGGTLMVRRLFCESARR